MKKRLLTLLAAGALAFGALTSAAYAQADATKMEPAKTEAAKAEAAPAAAPAAADAAKTADAKPADAPKPPNVNKGDTAFMYVATIMVILMTIPGLALFYGGLVRSRNVLSVLAQCFAIAGGVSLLWLLGLYSLCFGDGGSVNGVIGGLSKAFFAGVGKDSLSGDIPEVIFAGFQMTFAIITPALIIGAYAERVKFSAMLVFSLLWSVLVYAPVCHWVWGGDSCRRWASSTSPAVPWSTLPRVSRRWWPPSSSGRAEASARSRCRRTT